VTEVRQYVPRQGVVAVVSSSEFGVIANHELRRGGRTGEFCSFLWLRIDRRGPVALESSGIAAEELNELAELLALELRASDVVSVLSERDLAVLLCDTSPEQVPVVLEHLEASVLEGAQSGRSALVARCGWSSCAPDDEERELPALLGRAEAAATVAPSI
jgi:GGDEF domain-containing protein